MGSFTVADLESLRDDLNEAFKRGSRLGLSHLSDEALADLQRLVPRDGGYQPWWLKLILWSLLLLAGFFVGGGAIRVMLDFMTHIDLIDKWSQGPVHHVAGILLVIAVWRKLASISDGEERLEKALLQEVKRLAAAAMTLPWSTGHTPPLSQTSR